MASLKATLTIVVEPNGTNAENLAAEFADAKTKAEALTGESVTIDEVNHTITRVRVQADYP